VSVFEYAARNAGEIAFRTVQHLGLVGAATTFIGVAVGVPLGVAITRRPRARVIVLGVANVLQTVPSLALFGFLLPLPLLGGIGAGTAVVALVVYALLPIVRNTFVGITTIDPAVRDAAVGMGMTDRQILRLVELPLAMPVILAGVRTATVIGVGIATIAAAIGAGGLGDFIFRGLAMVDNAVILAGAVPAAALALVLDGVLHLIERRVDWRRPAGRGDHALT
jgi:osmoprotectant transport system permease protein